VLRWKRVGITIREGSEDMGSLLLRVVERVTRKGSELVLDREAARMLQAEDALELSEVARRADLMIVLGGDGTVLATSREIGDRDVPILGINLGRLGFMADVRPDEMDSALECALDGNYEIESRTRLSVTRLHADGEDEPKLVLNDAVITGAQRVARMIDLETRVNGNPLGRFRADGLIVCTPTGSTAYSLGAGGAILDPATPVIALTPICPQPSSHQRPIVLSDACEIEVFLREDCEGLLTLDGQVGLPLAGCEGVRVTRAAHPVRFLRLPGYDYYENLRSKLLWGSA